MINEQTLSRSGTENKLKVPMMDAKDFRAKLTKIMPGYCWTVHRAPKGAAKLVATGTKSSGFNRLSTLEVSYSDKWFTVRSAGYGLNAPWLHTNGDITLARALRGLQDHYRHMASVYRQHECDLEMARKVGENAA